MALDRNLLYYGDNLDILRNRVDTGTVDLCYVDPPFNSKRNYNQIYNRIGAEDHAQAQAFTDTWTWDCWADTGFDEILANEKGRYAPQAVDLITGLCKVLGKESLLAYVVHMTQRIAEVQRVLKPTGSFYLHCDPTASHYLKLVLDAVFCARGGDFQTEIVWKRSSAHSDTKQGRKQYGHVHDVLFFYTKGRDWTWNPQYTPYDDEYVANFYRYVEEGTGRRYRLGDLTAAKPGGDVSYEFHGTRPYKGRYWAYSRENMEAYFNAGRLLFPKSGGPPSYKRYLDEMPGVPLQDLWTDIKPIGPQAAERLGYQTQKPEALLERIIATSSNPGDVVLDAYCGCGTTIAVAERLARRWIGMDITYQSISLMLKRLERAFGPEAVARVSTDGIPRDMKSAQALAHKQDDRLRKEFEKWAVLTYTNNRAVINEKKGADAGIDATAFFQTGRTENAKVVFQVKSGAVQRDHIAKLRGDMAREGAALGVLITLEEPKGPMLREAKAAGQYRHELMGRSYDKISIVTVREIVEEGKRLDIPMSLEVLAAARRAADSEQVDLLLESGSDAGGYRPDSALPLRKAAERKPEGYPSKPKVRRKKGA